MDNYPQLLMIILLAWIIFGIIRLMNIYWRKEVFLLSSVVWINGRSTQNREMKNLRFYDLKILESILWWLLWWWWLFYDYYFMMILWWLFYDDFMIIIMMMNLWWLFHDDYFMMILWWWFYDDYFMMIILWWLFYDDYFVLKMFLKNENENENVTDISSVYNGVSS